MDVKNMFPNEQCRVSNGSIIVFSNSIFGGIRINQNEKGYIVSSSSEIKSISLALIILSILLMLFIVRLDSPLFYVASIFGLFVQLLSVFITESRILYIKTRIYTYYDNLNND